jgi:hypothetical protein
MRLEAQRRSLGARGMVVRSNKPVRPLNRVRLAATSESLRGRAFQEKG